MPQRLAELQRTLRQLISQSRPEQVIDRLLALTQEPPFAHLQNAVTQQSAAYQKWKTDGLHGILTRDEESRTLQKINLALLQIIDELGKPIPEAAHTPPATSSGTSNTQAVSGSGNISIQGVDGGHITIIHNPGSPAAEEPKRKTPTFWEWISRSNNLVGVIAGVITLASVFGLSSLFKPDPPLSLTVLLDNQMPNAYLPFATGKVTLIYGDKTEDKPIDKEAVFKGIPANFKKQPVIVRFEAEGFVPIDTTFQLTDNRIILPITRDNSLGRIFGTVKDEQGNPIVGAEISVQDLTATSTSAGNFELAIPFEKQRKSQRIKAHKTGYKPWDFESPIIQHVEISIVLVRQ